LDTKLGLGVDVIEIARVRRALARWGDRLLGRVFTAEEIAYCSVRRDPSASLAVRFAAKEAFAKAVPAGADPGWHEVEVVMGTGNKPALKLSPRLAQLLDGRRVALSLSHSEEMAMAAVVIA
jgi:holo-[acyl-carrier protein] synthase